MFLSLLLNLGLEKDYDSLSSPPQASGHFTLTLHSAWLGPSGDVGGRGAAACRTNQCSS